MNDLSMRAPLISIATFIFCLSALSCNRSLPPASESGPNVKHYRLTGRVVAIDKANKSLTIDGDEIPGFMSAMQMPYDVKNPNLLEQLAPGDKIAADIIVKDDESWIENITVTQPSPPASKPTSAVRPLDRSTA
jgi:protein SCO1/2